ncbi:hypothetical protein [Kitasatospora arboriphila]|uniref:Uncharacterized protein n=1 Tax=Kitasatospora arboriphila TaxID=258052 RepID=A0ABN1U066_9ACTN
MDTRTLLLLSVGAAVVYLSMHNPTLAAGLAVAATVVMLLDLMIKK